MQRELFSVEPAANGWQVVAVSMRPRRLATQFKAFQRACVMAREWHASTGRPTGVKVRLECGDVVLADPHG